MTSESFKPKKNPLDVKYAPPLTRPQSVGTLNENEAYDKFGSQRIDGLKIVSLETTSPGATTGHIVAFYKGIKVLIPIVQ